MSRQKPNAKAIKRREASRGIEKLAISADILQYKFPPFDTWDELKSAYEEAELGDFRSQPTEGIPLKARNFLAVPISSTHISFNFIFYHLI